MVAERGSYHAMPPPISQETFLTGMNMMRQLVTAWKTAENPEQAFTKLVPFQEAVLEFAEKVVVSIATLETKTTMLRLMDEILHHF